MKALGNLLVNLAALFLVSWGSHQATLAIWQSASTPPSGILELLWWTTWSILGAVVCWILAIPYVVLHTVVPNDTVFVITTMGIGLILGKFGESQGSNASA